MNKKIIILIIIWVLYIFSDYFILPYFIQPFIWLIFVSILFVILIRQIFKIFKERKNPNRTRFIKFSIILTRFLLTFYNFNKIPKFIIEIIDWKLFYNTRNKIVSKVLHQELKPNSELNNGICELPFKFPIVSNGGNDIWIYENKTKKTIKFWISRGFFDSPQKYFIFTNDENEKKNYDELIKSHPEYNWKLEENWYRIMER